VCIDDHAAKRYSRVVTSSTDAVLRCSRVRDFFDRFSIENVLRCASSSSSEFARMDDCSSQLGSDARYVLPVRGDYFVQNGDEHGPRGVRDRARERCAMDRCNNSCARKEIYCFAARHR